jgi:hypothetical protein
MEAAPTLGHPINVVGLLSHPRPRSRVLHYIVPRYLNAYWYTEAPHLQPTPNAGCHGEMEVMRVRRGTRPALALGHSSLATLFWSSMLQLLSI